MLTVSHGCVLKLFRRGWLLFAFERLGYLTPALALVPLATWLRRHAQLAKRTVYARPIPLLW